MQTHILKQKNEPYNFLNGYLQTEGNREDKIQASLNISSFEDFT